MKKFLLAFILCACVFGGGNYLQTSLLPTTTTDIAMNQVNGGDQEFETLRSYELMKNWLHLGEFIICSGILLVIYKKDLDNLVAKAKKTDETETTNS